MNKPPLKFLLKYPTRSRPDIFKETCLNWMTQFTPYPHRMLVTIDEDDATMRPPAMRDWMLARAIDFNVVDRGTKVSSINQGVNECTWDWDILIALSDDVRVVPGHHGFSKTVAELFEQKFPNLDGVLHFNDGRQSAAICTTPIIGRKYYDRFGYIFHPSYRSVYCDNEFTEVAKRSGKYHYIDELILRHYWTDITGTDHLHCESNRPADYRTDLNNFLKRQFEGFPS